MVTQEALCERAEQGLAALDELLLPLDSAVAQWPAVRVLADSAFYLRQGQPVLVPRAPTSQAGCPVSRRPAVLGLGEIIDDGQVAPRRLLAD